MLVVSPEPGGEHCAFRADVTECGVCLASRCVEEIDSACFDDEVLTALETCAVRGDVACEHLPPSSLTTCLQQKCAAWCSSREGTSLTQCEDSLFGPGLACSCRLNDTPNNFACSSALYTRSICCAPPGWPGPALSCTCEAVACVPSTDGCICTLSEDLGPETASQCPGVHCCAVEDRCQCRTRACSGGEREVAVCNKAALQCPPGRHEVPSCSIRQ